jgi:hypothetical protein
MSNIEENYQNILNVIEASKREDKNKEGSPKIIAVSKTRTLSEIQNAYNCGIRNFGENYLQEAVTKIHSFPHSVNWHFIGSIQSNKTKQIARYFQWVHTITRLKIATQINQYRAEPINVCIQIKLQNDDNRESVFIDDLPMLAHQIKELENIKLRGLMGMTSGDLALSDRPKYFNKLTKAFDNLNKQGLNLDTISMGMSEDYDLAIQNRSNMIRIGTALFGKRAI